MIQAVQSGLTVLPGAVNLWPALPHYVTYTGKMNKMSAKKGRSWVWAAFEKGSSGRREMSWLEGTWRMDFIFLDRERFRYVYILEERSHFIPKFWFSPLERKKKRFLWRLKLNESQMHGGGIYTAKPFTHANYYNCHHLGLYRWVSPGHSCAVLGFSTLCDTLWGGGGLLSRQGHDLPGTG